VKFPCGPVIHNPTLLRVRRTRLPKLSELPGVGSTQRFGHLIQGNFCPCLFLDLQEVSGLPAYMEREFFVLQLILQFVTKGELAMIFISCFDAVQEISLGLPQC
jgi:hypothetical protein